MTHNWTTANDIVRFEPRLPCPPGRARDPIAESTRVSLETIERARSAGNQQIEAIVADALRDIGQPPGHSVVERSNRDPFYWTVYDFVLCHGPAMIALL